MNVFYHHILKTYDRRIAIYASGGTVDSVLLCGIERHDAVAQLLRSIDNGIELIHANYLEVAIVGAIFIAFLYIAVLPCGRTAFEHQACSFFGIACFHQSAHKLCQYLAIATEHVGRSNDVVGKIPCLRQRLYIAHKAVVEVQRVQAVNACSLHGIIHLVHIHPFAFEPLI